MGTDHARLHTARPADTRSRLRLARRVRVLTVAGALGLTLLVAMPADAGTGQDGSFPSYNESSGCGFPSNSKPQVTHTGWLPDSEAIRGPAAGFLGRSIGGVREQLVWWDVPMSNGERIQVHVRALPAFERVAANLAENVAAGRYYAIRAKETYGFVPRTINGRYSLSYHGLGTAVDINARSNPARSDNVLVTNMPSWFVEAWTEAGFCWGGSWNNSKDAMHFAWMGPAFTPGYGDLPQGQPVTSAPAPFDVPVQDTATPFGAPKPGAQYVVADGSGDGAVDVLQISENSFGMLVEYSRAGDRHAWCSVGRGHAAGLRFEGRTALLGDYGRTGNNDLWLVGPTGGQIKLTIYLRATNFSAAVAYTTDLAAAPDDVYLIGDYDGNHVADLFVVRRGSGETRLDVRLGPDFATGPQTYATSLGDTSTADWHFALGDRDVDGRSDLHAVTTSGATHMDIVLAADAYGPVAESHALADLGTIEAIALADFDGEGRPDLQVLDSTGRFRAFLGNASVYADSDEWFVPPNWSCSDDDVPFSFNGAFRDDDDNVHEANIDSIAARGITLGCNPPYGDEFCPHRAVTRGEMAAFITRMLDLPAAGGTDWYTDDDGSTFEADINRLAQGAIARGCNPPENDRYCPDQVMNRAQFAAMLVRALGLTETGQGNRFLDDDGSIFEQDIARLAFSGITMGCNPPANDRFCPGSPVERDQMASFLERAALLISG